MLRKTQPVKMNYKITIATILSLIACGCCILIVLGMVGVVDLEIFSIASELGIRILCYIAVSSLLLVAILYYEK